MSTLQMSVKGVKRNVHLETALNSAGKTRARTNVGKSTVSGYVTINSAGAKRFTPIGKNAHLV
jgi:hypothetical protein